MSNHGLSRLTEKVPAVFDEFFRPWNEWFDNNNFGGRFSKMPAVNITEEKNTYEVSLAAPGLRKDDFKIDVDGEMLTISSEKEDSREEKDKRFTRKEYSYSSFSRSFKLPDEVNKEKIEARYENGLLTVVLPRKEAAKKEIAKQIVVK